MQIVRSTGDMELLERGVAAYGSFTRLAKALHVPLSTVHGWSRRGSVPEWRRPALRVATKSARRRKPKAA